MRNSFISFVFLVILVSCRTQQIVPVPEFHHEVEVQRVRDTLLQKDSIVLHTFTRGDTVILQERHYHQVINRAVRDSIILKTDSIRVPYPVEVVKKEKLLTRLARDGLLCFVMCVIFVFVCFIKNRLKKS